MGEQPPTRRRVPGGALPRSYARPRLPAPNGHGAAPDPAEAWQRLDAEEGQQAEGTRFRRVAEIVPDAAVTASGRPATVVVVATLVVVAVVVLAVVLYRMAPP